MPAVEQPSVAVRSTASDRSADEPASASAPALPWLPPVRRERWLLAVGIAFTTFAVVMTRVVESASWVRFWDNVHWTTSYGVAAGLAFMARGRAQGLTRAARHWFALALGVLFGGQLLWDAQVFFGWNPFPGPSDALFVSMGPLAVLATFTLTRGQSRVRRVALALDALGFALSVLALTLATYLPSSGEVDAFTLMVLVAYPTALLTATAMFVLVVFELRRRVNLGCVLLACGLLAHGSLWMEWNLATLEGRLGDGIGLNYLFSYATLLLGTGIATCEFLPQDLGGRWARAYYLASRSLPLGFVVAAALAVSLSGDMQPAVRMAVNLCMGGVILVAVLRQSLLLEERDRLLETEAQNRALSERLSQRQRMESLGTLASGIAHDFNNLLTAILGHAELLASRSLDREATDSVTAVRAAALRARDVVQRILAFSRQEATRPEAVEAGALVREVAALLSAALPAAHRLVVSEAPRLGVLVSPAQIHQVLMNLGTNASQAMGERAGEIRFAVREVSIEPGQPGIEPGSYVEIAVADAGMGMDAATQAKMFEPFFTTKPRGQGTGLGLSVAHGIVTEHGGAIRVESRPGQGTTVRVLLPRTSLPTAEFEREPRSQNLVLPPASREALVVDDEPVIGRVLTRMLERLGQPAMAVTSPKMAIELVTAAPNRYWLVVTDMSMPSMNGSDLAQRLREVGFKGTLVLSSGTDFVVAGSPFDDVLPKPYETSAVESLLSRHRVEPAEAGMALG